MKKSPKCIFLTNHELDESRGISKKINRQVVAIRQVGIITNLISYKIINGHQLALLDGQPFYSLGNRVSKIIFRNGLFYNKLYQFIINNDVTFLYIRYTQFVDLPFLRFLRKTHKLPCKIMMEIPTYPYDGEFPNTKFKYRIIKRKDQLLRSFFHHYVDRIITFSCDKTIFGIPCINISNAVDENSVRLVKDHMPNNNRIKMVGVANLNFWHGYDRMIEGLYNYYRSNYQTCVCFDIVGEGNPEVFSLLKEMISKYHLEEYVRMLGPKMGDELDSIFDSSDVAIGSLGSHRKNIIETKTLKNVEYAMRGLPIVYAERNLDFDNMIYVYKVPSDDTPINIFNIVNFVKANHFAPINIRNTVSHLTWRNQMKIVFEQIKKDQ